MSDTDLCPCGCNTPMRGGKPMADHPHVNPGDGRAQCPVCGKFVWPVSHSCKGIRYRTRG